MSNGFLRGAALVLLSLTTAISHAAVINIVNLDAQDEGLNDVTPRAPVGGNNGSTLGQQRLNALRFAADILAQRIVSSQIILVGSNFDPLTCEPDNADLGAAGATILVSDFTGTDRTATFYPIALANALSGQDISPERDITATFNSTLDDNAPSSLACLGGASWYYGLDNNPPPNMLDFISTATHELVHGLGFASFTQLQDDPATPQDDRGQFQQDIEGTPLPDIFSVFIRDLTRGETWPQLSAAERAESARNDGNLVWDGASSTSQGAPTLVNGTNQGRIQLFAPSMLLVGSSVSHWDTAVAPNALMEPFETAANQLLQGIGLASCLLEDIGWELLNNTRCPDGDASTPNNGNDGDDGDDRGDGGSEDEDPVISSTDGGGSGTVISDSSGGGCVLGKSKFDPTLPLMLFLAIFYLGQRRRQSRENGPFTPPPH